MTARALRSDTLDNLIACPKCDVLHEVTPVEDGAKARCRRCHTTLIEPSADAFLHVILLAVTVLILMIAAIFFPFLKLEHGEIESHSSVFDTVMSFSHAAMLPLSIAVAALIIIIPLTRVATIIYTLWPLVRGKPAYAHAPWAMRVAEALKPWSMAEVFIIGVAVSLVKIGGIAHVSLGPAFWAFVALVIVVALQDTFMCKWTIWNSLETSRNT
jgi:paraquat-inducible protein A